MTLRTKTLIIIGLTLVTLIALLYAVTRTLWLDGFERIEQTEMQGSVRQAVFSIEADREALTTLASDYAGWDDTYEFIVDVNEAYRLSNLIDSTFNDTGLNLTAFIATDGRNVFTRLYERGEKALPPDVADIARHLPELLAHGGIDSTIAGLVMIEGRPMLVSSHPILRSDKTGPPRGTLVMGRYLDGQRHRHLASRTGSMLRLHPVAGAPRTERLAETLGALAAGAESHVVPLDVDRLAGFALLRDLRGAPALLLELERERSVYAQGRLAFWYFVSSLTATALVVGLVTIVLLERVVLRRISGLGEAVKAVGRESDLSARLPVRGRDEIADLAGAINTTLADLERSQGAIQYIGRHARCILWSATVETRPNGEVSWDFQIQDEEAAGRMLPLDVFRGGSYAHAWRRSIHPEDQDRVREATHAALRAGEASCQQEFRVRGRDGIDRWVHEEIDIERDGPDRWRLVGVCTDLTARKHAEAELQRARDAALDLAATKSDFLANMSHEIRTPMNGILGTTELLRGTELSDEQSEYLDLIATSADNLLAVIDDVLDFSKIEAGRLELDEAGFGLRGELLDALGLLAVRAHQKSLELALDVEPEVPDGLIGDQVRLRQIIVNLVGNAIKFTDRGEIVVHVSAEPVDDEQVYLHVAVADSGVGIPADKQDLIFQAFRQADGSTTRRFGGTGLGLAISSQLAQQMHGRMHVESAEREGSTFRFSALLRVQPGTGREAPVSDLAGRTVLLVDDNATARDITARMLGRLGAEVTDVADAAGARAAIDAAPRAFDLLVCDAVMPRASGFDLVARLRKDRLYDGPCVMTLLGSDRAADATRCRAAGIHGSVTKPFLRAQLRAAIDAALRGSRARSDAAADFGGHPVALRPLRVLLAEDDAVNQRVASRMIERGGHSAVVASDGEAAVAALEAEPFDVVLMDVQMPALGGFEATTRIRERERVSGRRVPIIAMTAHAAHGDRERCMEHGMDGYVAKPISAGPLFAEIARLLPDAVLPDAGYGTPGGGRYDRRAALVALGHDESLLAEVIQLFLREYPKQWSALLEAERLGDFGELERTVRALEGSLGSLHARDALRATRRLADAVRSGDRELVRGGVRELEQEIECLRPHLRRETHS